MIVKLPVVFLLFLWVANCFGNGTVKMDADSLRKFSGSWIANGDNVLRVEVDASANNLVAAWLEYDRPEGRFELHQFRLRVFDVKDGLFIFNIPSSNEKVFGFFVNVREGRLAVDRLRDVVVEQVVGQSERFPNFISTDAVGLLEADDIIDKSYGTIFLERQDRPNETGAVSEQPSGEPE